MMKMMGSWVGKIIDVAAPADCRVNYSKVKVKKKNKKKKQQQQKKTKNNKKKKTKNNKKKRKI